MLSRSTDDNSINRLQREESEIISAIKDWDNNIKNERRMVEILKTQLDRGNNSMSTSGPSSVTKRTFNNSFMDDSSTGANKRTPGN